MLLSNKVLALNAILLLFPLTKNSMDSVVWGCAEEILP